MRISTPKTTIVFTSANLQRKHSTKLQTVDKIQYKQVAKLWSNGQNVASCERWPTDNGGQLHRFCRSVHGSTRSLQHGAFQGTGVQFDSNWLQRQSTYNDPEPRDCRTLARFLLGRQQVHSALGFSTSPDWHTSVAVGASRLWNDSHSGLVDKAKHVSSARFFTGQKLTNDILTVVAVVVVVVLMDVRC
jgi:hypothetical protein